MLCLLACPKRQIALLKPLGAWELQRASERRAAWVQAAPLRGDLLVQDVEWVLGSQNSDADGNNVAGAELCDGKATGDGGEELFLDKLLPPPTGFGQEGQRMGEQHTEVSEIGRAHV